MARLETAYKKSHEGEEIVLVNENTSNQIE
jgi:hypothetical protein